MKPGDTVVVAFIAPGMDYANYAGKATLVRVSPEDWSYDGNPGEIHWEARLPNGEVCNFPLSSIHELK